MRLKGRVGLPCRLVYANRRVGIQGERRVQDSNWTTTRNWAIDHRQLFVPQGPHRIDLGGAAGGEISGQGGRREQYDEHRSEGGRIVSGKENTIFLSSGKRKCEPLIRR